MAARFVVPARERPETATGCLQSQAGLASTAETTAGPRLTDEGAGDQTPRSMARIDAMTEKSKPKHARASRRDRLGDALRDNLKKRKAQARARNATGCDGRSGTDGGRAEAAIPSRGRTRDGGSGD